MDPVGQIIESVPFLDLDGLLQDCIASVDLLDHLVDHQAGRVVLELAGLEVLVRTLDRSGTIVLA